MAAGNKIPYNKYDITSEEELKQKFDIGRKKHPGGCYGMWTLRVGLLKALCEGCGYTMKINSATGELEHLENIHEAMEGIGEARNFIANHPVVDCPCDICSFARRHFQGQTI